MKLGRLTTLLLSLAISISAFAFDFTGKSFRYEEVGNNGAKATITFTFNVRGSGTLKTQVTGHKAETVPFYWEVSGDFINVQAKTTGEMLYLGIDQECDGAGNCEIVLIGTDDYGNPEVVLRQVKSTGTSKSTTKKATKKRR